MKAITLYQPWASLCSSGAKKYETRSWATDYRGPIAIHAGMKKPSSIWRVIEGIIDEVRADLGIVDPDNLPRGEIIAIAELVDCRIIGLRDDKEITLVGLGGKEDICVRGNEIKFGDYTPGRFGWILENVQVLKNPIPVKGHQKLWDWDETPHLVTIDPYMIGNTSIWTPQGVRTGKICKPDREDAISGLEVA